MKDKNDKKKFKESKIGKIIYGFLLFMPLLAIGVTCGYAMFNKNAYKSYTGSTSYLTTQKINTFLATSSANTITEGVVNNIHNYCINNYNLGGTAHTINYEQNDLSNITNQSFLIINVSSLIIDNNEIENAKCVVFTRYSNLYDIKIFDQYFNYTTYYTSTVTGHSGKMYFRDNTGTNIYENIASYMIQDFTGGQLVYTPHIISFVNSENNYYYRVDYSFTTLFEKSIFYTENTLSNVFYYSIDKVTQSPLFNWVTRSNIYTGMHNFTTAMSVTNTFLPMLLTYWLIISVIYFLYDMILVLLTVLHRKIHNLQDSI